MEALKAAPPAGAGGPAAPPAPPPDAPQPGWAAPLDGDQQGGGAPEAPVPERAPGEGAEKPPTTAATIAEKLQARKGDADATAKKAGRIDVAGATDILENNLEQKDPAEQEKGKADIRALLADPKVTIDPKGREALKNYLRGGAALPGDEGQPASGFLSSATRYGPGVSGPSAAKLPSKDDVRQGDAGDCYMAATMASLAQHDPQAIRDAVRDRPDGKYDVKLFVRGPDGQPVERTVTVDGKLPLDKDGKPAYMQPVGGQNWAPILEKAFAKLNGGYGFIGAGGASADAMFTLTGKQGTTTALRPDMTPEARDEAFARLRTAFDAGHMTTAGTTSDKKLLTGRYDEGHQYTVTGIGGQGDQRYVQVQNPYGLHNAEGEHRSGVDAGDYKPGRKTATVQVPIDKFFRRFDEFSTGPTR